MLNTGCLAAPSSSVEAAEAWVQASACMAPRWSSSTRQPQIASLDIWCSTDRLAACPGGGMGTVSPVERAALLMGGSARPSQGRSPAWLQVQAEARQAPTSLPMWREQHLTLAWCGDLQRARVLLKAALGTRPAQSSSLSRQPGAPLLEEGCWPPCAEVMSVVVAGHRVAPWLMVLGPAAGLLERAAFFRRGRTSPRLLA